MFLLVFITDFSTTKQPYPVPLKLSLISNQKNATECFCNLLPDPKLKRIRFPTMAIRHQDCYIQILQDTSLNRGAEKMMSGKLSQIL